MHLIQGDGDCHLLFFCVAPCCIAPIPANAGMVLFYADEQFPLSVIKHVRELGLKSFSRKFLSNLFTGILEFCNLRLDKMFV